MIQIGDVTTTSAITWTSVPATQRTAAPPADRTAATRTTRQIYTHVSDPMMEGAIEAIAAIADEVIGNVDDDKGSTDGSMAVEDEAGDAANDDGSGG